jgi:hypothetical protein
MNADPFGYEVGLEVAYNEALGHWYLVQKQMKGNVLHTNILEMTYDSEDAAREAAAHYAKPGAGA